MNKFLVTSEATKDDVTKALTEGKIDCVVEQHKQDCFLVDLRVTDLPENRQSFSQEENMSYIESFEQDIRRACVDVLVADDASSDDEDDSDKDIPSDTEDELPEEA